MLSLSYFSFKIKKNIFSANLNTMLTYKNFGDSTTTANILNEKKENFDKIGVFYFFYPF